MTDTTAAPNARDVFRALTIQRPDDIPFPTPLLWMAQRHTDHEERLSNRDLPADFPYPVQRGDASDALAVLALGVEIEQSASRWRAITIRTALLCGATWRQIADAIGITPAEARAVLQKWAQGQFNLFRGDVERGENSPLGINDAAYARLMAFLAVDDDTPATAAQGD